MFSREILRVKARTEPIPRRRAWRLASLRFTNCLKRREMLQSRHFLQPARNIPPTGQWAECPPYKCWHDGPGPGLERTGGAGGSWSGCGWSRETTLSYWVVNQDSPTREGEIAGWPGWVAGLWPATAGGGREGRLQKFGSVGEILRLSIITHHHDI